MHHQLPLDGGYARVFLHEITSAVSYNGLSVPEQSLRLPIPQKGLMRKSAKHLRPLIESVIDEMERCIQKYSVSTVGDDFTSIDPNEWKLIDEKLGFGLSEGSFGTSFMLPPEDGYAASPFAIRMSISEFIDNECRVLYVSRTLTELELTANLLAQVTGADVDRVPIGHLIEVEWDRLVNALERLLALDFSIVHTQQLSLSQLDDWMDDAATEPKAKLLIVLDDERLMAADPERSANGLTRLAKKYDAAIASVFHNPLH